MHKFIILFLFFLISCASPPVNDSFFDPFKSLFELYSLQYGKPVSADIAISFGSMPNKETAGYCQRNVSNKFIVINKTIWNKIDKYQKEVLIFHELGHCILDREHENIAAEDECPESIMYWRVLQSYCYRDNKSYYLEELFK